MYVVHIRMYVLYIGKLFKKGESMKIANLKESVHGDIEGVSNKKHR